MKLLFKQRFFSWLDSYDIYDEQGNTVFTVKGQLSWGHCLKIFDALDNYVGMVKQEVFSFMPRFAVYMGDDYVGCIKREFTFFRPKYNIDFNGWSVEGDLFEWEYDIMNVSSVPIAHVSKELWNFTDTYTIEVANSTDALPALMLVLAIDAEKCSRN